MRPIIALVGRSNSGKTMLLEKLIPALEEKGYRVGVIKHTTGRYPLDKEGKDSWRFAKAGAKTVAFSTPDGFALMRYAAWDLSEIAKLMPGMDLVLAEGHKGGSYPKIIVHRPGVGDPPELTDPIIATVGSLTLNQVPSFKHEEVDGIVDFIMARVGPPSQQE
jgi:molybdopterin-guanine dinucleotide biosynthesis protein B